MARSFYLVVFELDVFELDVFLGRVCRSLNENGGL